MTFETKSDAEITSLWHRFKLDFIQPVINLLVFMGDAFFCIILNKEHGAVRTLFTINCIKMYLIFMTAIDSPSIFVMRKTVDIHAASLQIERISIDQIHVE